MSVETSTAPSSRPTFSLISACFNVAAYLDEFADSIENQTIRSEDLEVIVVDDGSTDTTLEQLERLAHRSRFRWQVLTQANAGQGAARNLGLDHATGTWSTFVDPDDWLDERYLAAIAAFKDEFPQTELVAGARVPMREGDDGLRRGSHPLDSMFTADVLVDLDRSPDYFHGSAPAAFLRTDRLVGDGLRFDPLIRPNFEDAHFIARYLLDCERPLVGFVGSARYYYRKRADGTSSTQASYCDPARFTVVPRRGILDLLERALSVRSIVPFWLQNLVLYELSYYFSDDEENSSEPGYACRGAVAEGFLTALNQIAMLLSPDMVRGFRVRRFDPAWRDILLHGTQRERWHTPYAVVDVSPDGVGEVRVRYVGDPPQLTVLSAGEPTTTAGEHRRVEYFGAPLLWERVVAVDEHSTVRVLVGGAHLPLRRDWEPQVCNSLTAGSHGGRRVLFGRRSVPSGALPAASLRSHARRRFRMDFRWRARRKARHLLQALTRR